MAKTISASGSGAVRTILKNKEAFEFALRSKETEGNRIRYFYDVFYENTNGTLNIAVEDGDVKIASLNLSLGKVINLYNDKNLKKLCHYVLDHTEE
ncbi:hypothetical protein [Dubosiella newyorkensis]|uniref:hypothetical protein n=1 Tax=Dubosiella newyorkensis TaxID=1862672 RepID=UPI002674FCA6|nr:hypothetical protein [Dubosiella newyorkensis]